jgi:hypothetical protein
MSPQQIQIASRRRLLQYLAASPLLARGALAEGLRPPDPADWAPRNLRVEFPSRFRRCGSRLHWQVLLEEGN